MTFHSMLELLFSPTGVVVALMSLTKCPGRLVDHDLTIFFDVTFPQHAALLEAMEQQQISVAKAGVVCTLPARTAIIAAANPVGGHYTRSKTVAENLKMGSALLSRFDLVFILIDKPDEEQDQRLTEHVIALHSKHLGSRVAETQVRGGCAQTLASTQGIGQLAERLAPTPGLIKLPFF